MSKPCTCSNTKDPAGNCDGSHKNLTFKSTPFDKITIRVIGMTSGVQRMREVFPSLASNTSLLRKMGYVISDPNYDAKMECVRNKKPFSVNGKSSEPKKESFAPPAQTPKPEVKIEQPKGEVAPLAPETKAKRAYKKRATKTETQPQ